ncbi:MAG TPA: hypothetical protein VK588_10810, partial [Chitinophagaceae bacterium]|nr:hypothetical protein [Chitinophagaceae bacterium]
MQKTFHFKLLPSEALNDSLIKSQIAQSAGVSPEDISGYNILKKSIDARGRQPWINLSLSGFINEPWLKRARVPFHYRDVSHSSNAVIIIG